MSLVKRVDDLEDSLSPRAAFILWMREAHEFESLLDYGAWLLDQPEDVYPLIRMPAQVVAAVRKNRKGQPDRLLRGEFYRVQRDLLFLYHLHQQVNIRAIGDEEALRLKLTLLTQGLRGIICQIWAADTLRVERFQFPEDLSQPPPKRRRKKTKVADDLEAEIAAWPTEEEMLRADVLAFLEAVRLISRRYLGGEELLFPHSARGLEGTLDALANLRDVYRIAIGRRPPESDEDFLRWMMESVGKDRKLPEDPNPEPVAEREPNVGAAARALAEHFGLMAKAEALEALGEKDAGIRLVEEWMRRQGSESLRASRYTRMQAL